MPRRPARPLMPAPGRRRTGWPWWSARCAATPAPTSSWPPSSSTTTWSRPGWRPGRSTRRRPARSSPRWSGCPAPASSPSPPNNARQAEAHLVALAAEHDAKALRVIGRRIFEVIAPDLAEKFEGKALGGRGSRGAAPDDVHDAGGRRGHRPRPVPDPGPARPDAAQDDPRPHLTLTVRCRSDCRATDPDLPTPVRDGIAFTELIESITAKSCRRPVAVAPPSWSP